MNTRSKPDLVAIFSFAMFVHCVSAASDLSFLRESHPAGVLPRSIAISDIDRDGDLDICLTNPVSNGTARMFVNDGQGGFGTGPVISFGLLSFPQGNAFGDLDHDGDDDLVVTIGSLLDPSIRIYLNDGIGNFGYADSFSTGAALGQPSVLEITGDGMLDIVSPSSEGITLFRQESIGEFVASVSDSPISGGQHGLEFVDADRDGDTDIVALSTGRSVYSNDGHGMFTVPDHWFNSLPYSALDSGEVTGDGIIDLAISERDEARVGIWTGDGNGRFRRSINDIYPLGEHPEGIVLGDIDSDGDLDILAADYFRGLIVIRFNDGAGNFDSMQTIPGLQTPSELGVADIDRDGDLDIIVSESTMSRISILRNQLNSNGPCNAADVAEPRSVLDINDLAAFIGFFLLDEPAADIAPPLGLLDLADIVRFIDIFIAGCGDGQKSE